MTLSDLSSIVGVISGLAVLGSLIYLAQQTRQNAKHTRALIQQSRAVQSTDLPLRWAEDASLVDLIFRGRAGDITFDQVQINRYLMLETSMLWYFEDQFHQHRDGLVAENRFDGSIKTLEATFQTPGFRLAWKQSRFLFGSQFQSFMDDIMLRTRVATRPDAVAGWKAGIAAELSEAST